MGHHIDAEGRFQSDKYPWLPPDMILLSTYDSAARRAFSGWAIGQTGFKVKVLLDFQQELHKKILRLYAGETNDRDLADDILARLESLGKEA